MERFTDSGLFPSSHEPPHSHQAMLQADSKNVALPFVSSRLDGEGIELLLSFLKYESKKRISAEEAMKHSYFRQLGMRVHTLPENVSIFTLKEVQLQRDPGYRNSSYPESGNGKINRRQSMLF